MMKSTAAEMANPVVNDHYSTFSNTAGIQRWSNVQRHPGGSLAMCEIDACKALVHVDRGTLYEYVHLYDGPCTASVVLRESEAAQSKQAQRTVIIVKGSLEN